MQTSRVVLRERCNCSGVLTRRRPFRIEATASGGLGIPPLARVVRLAAACGFLVALTALPARAQAPRPTNDAGSRGKETGAVRSESAQLLAGSPKDLQSVVAGTPPTLGRLARRSTIIGRGSESLREIPEEARSRGVQHWDGGWGGTAGPGLVVYENITPMSGFYPAGANVTIGDDMSLAGTEREIASYDNVYVFASVVCAEKVCVGGANDGDACLNTDSDCPGGVCAEKVCVGGTNDGDACVNTDPDCPAGVCAEKVCAGGVNEGELCAVDSDCYGPNYNVTMELWTDDGSGEPAGPGAPSAVIDGTHCKASGLTRGTIWSLRCIAAQDIRLPARVWMMLTFSTDDAGWVITEQAETGFTEDIFWLDPPGRLFPLAPDPDPLYAGFAGTIRTGQQPPVEIDRFESSIGQVQLNFESGGSEVIALSGPTTVHVFFRGTTEGGANDSDGNGLDEVDTEMVDMQLTGNSVVFGPVLVTLNPTKPSRGQIEETVNNTPGTLDIPPFTGTGEAYSFFDVFFKVQVEAPFLCHLLHNETPKHMRAKITHKPPLPGEAYEFPEIIPLFTETGASCGFSIGPASHIPSGNPGACCDKSQPGGLCVSNVPESQCLGSGIAVFTDPVAFEAFNAAEGKFTKGIEDFEESIGVGGFKITFPDPLVGNVANAGFPNGLTQKNLIIQANITPGPSPLAPNPSGSPIALFVIGPGFAGSNSKKVGEDLEVLDHTDTSLDLIFTEPNHTGVGFELSHFQGYGGGDWTITVYNKADDIIGVFLVPTAVEPTKNFFGVWTPQTIGRINIYDDGIAPDAVDDIWMWVGPPSQNQWHKGEDCIADGGTVDCQEHTGACCNHALPGGGCVDNVAGSQCLGGQREFFKDEPCAAVEARGDCAEHTGACCDMRIADPALRCQNDIPESLCPIDDPRQVQWYKDTDCSAIDCPEHTGACCDEDSFGTCQDNLPASQCNCKKCVFYKDTPCAEIVCLHKAIPTVSQWGLVVLTLLLLTGAKVYFGRRSQAVTSG